MNSAVYAQTEQTVPPISVMRELLIRTESDCYAEIGERVWTSDLPTRKEFTNQAAGLVLVDNGAAPDPRVETELFENAVARIRIWSGTENLSDCGKVWHLVRKTLLRSDGVNLSNAKEGWSARWCWAKVIEAPTQIRQHPETGWPELNALIEYCVQGTEGD